MRGSMEAAMLEAVRDKSKPSPSPSPSASPSPDPVPKPKPARKYTRKLDTIILSPERAAELLEHNSYNRPLSQPHVERIARQIRDGKWKFNGDTIKISTNGDVLDGQHRLWAVLEAKKAIETVIVYGIERDAFATIDTIRKHRSM